MIDTAKSLRESIITAVMSRQKDSAILLSGGIDSATVLAASLALDRKPNLVTFKIKGRREHSDLIVAKSMAKATGLDIFIAEISRDDLIRDCKIICKLSREYSLLHPGVLPVYKVFVQVAHGCIYMMDEMKRIGSSIAMTGFCADSYWGSGRKMSVLLKTDIKAWQEYREKYLISEFNSESFVYWIASKRGLLIDDPWADMSISQLMLNLNYQQMHIGRSKGLALQAFPEFWKLGAWARDNSSLQVNSGLRELHDTLLSMPINTNRNKAVIGIYNDMVKKSITSL